MGKDNAPVGAGHKEERWLLMWVTKNVSTETFKIKSLTKRPNLF